MIGCSATSDVNVNAPSDMTNEHTVQRKWLSISHAVIKNEGIDVPVVVRTLHTVLMGAHTGHMDDL